MTMTTKIITAAAIALSSILLSGCLPGSPKPVDVAEGQHKESDGPVVFGEKIVEGIHYRSYEPFDANMEPVTVLFWYGCPHCQNLRPVLEDFKERTGESVDERHALFSKNWLADASFFYTANQQGMRFPKLHEAYFDKRETQSYPLTESQLADLLDRKGMTLESFTGGASSGQLNEQILRVREMQVHYEVIGVPTIIVGGRHVLNNEQFQSSEHMMASAEALLESMGWGAPEME